MNDRSDTARAGNGMPAFDPAIGLREVLEAAPDLVFCCDAWGRVAWASGSFESLTGYRTNDLVGVSFATLLHPCERAHAFIGMCRELPPIICSDVVRGPASKLVDVVTSEADAPRLPAGDVNQVGHMLGRRL